ncbi:MAG: TRAP transporter small permease subunit, partial [Alphaproteobacteria bacterium]|nr:TRAP transporter small permease subunit [Alphaproteobacteria bacterium]
MTTQPKTDIARTIFVTVPRAIIAALILGGIAINFANVVSRHVFSAAIFWAEEILVFLVIWFVSIAVAAVTYQGAHLKMDLLSTRLTSP